MSLDLDRALVARLDTLGVRIEVADANTVAFKNVPAHPQRFTKARTNLLMQRPRPGLPFIVGVDEDLEYVGPDPALARLFAAGLRQRGWCVLRLDTGGHGRFQQVVERALAVIGFDGAEPAFDPQGASGSAGARSGLLAGATSLTALVRAGRSQPTVGRVDRIGAVASSVMQWQSCLPIIAGVPGVGKTNLLHGVARRLADMRPSLDLVRVDLAEILAGTLFDAERENLLVTLLEEAKAPGLVLCVERVDLVRLALPEGPLVLDAALEEGVRLIGTATPQAIGFLRSLPLAHRIRLVEIDEPDAGTVLDVLLVVRDQLARYHQVTIEDPLVRAAAERAAFLEGYFPAKAIALLDAAASRAALAGSPAVELIHVYLAAGEFPEQAGPTTAAGRDRGCG